MNRCLLFFKEMVLMKLAETGLTAEELKEKTKKYMIETYERFDFVADSASGVYMYDDKGTPYLDFYAGIAVNSVGNCCKPVVDAVCEQAACIETVSDKMKIIAEVVENTSASADRSAEISEKLKEEAQTLKKLVAGFRLNK